MPTIYIAANRLELKDKFFLNERQRKPREVAHIHFFGQSHEIEAHRGKMLVVTPECHQILLDPLQKVIIRDSTRFQNASIIPLSDLAALKENLDRDPLPKRVLSI